MRILFTGMASSHCTKPKNTSFFAALSDMTSTFAEVVWASPKMSWTKQDLDSFDFVFFGLTPPTSLSANKLYPALKLLDEMFSSPKLVLVADGAQMWQYKNSFNALKRDYNILLGSFYAKRADYREALERPAFLESLVSQMENEAWPVTLYPQLPWDAGTKIYDLLSFITPSSIKGFNLDAALIKPEVPRIGRSDYWSVENTKSSWLEKFQATLSLPLSPNKAKRSTDDSAALVNIEESIGLIIPPQERDVGTWWNYRIFQAINSGTPVVTQWQDTASFDHSWSRLGYQIEDMSPAERASIASQQRHSYVSAIPPALASQQQLQKILVELSQGR